MAIPVKIKSTGESSSARSGNSGKETTAKFIKQFANMDYQKNTSSPGLIDLPKYLDERGNLSFIEEETHLPFRIRRIYWIYDVPGGEHRGGHAFRETEELIVALSGSFDVVINNGLTEVRFALNRSYYGVYVPKMVWRTLENFSTNSLALFIASTDFSEGDYIRDFDEFCSLKKNG